MCILIGCRASEITTYSKDADVGCQKVCILGGANYCACCVAVNCSEMQCAVVYCSVLRRVAACCGVSQRVAACCSVF